MIFSEQMTSERVVQICYHVIRVFSSSYCIFHFYNQSSSFGVSREEKRGQNGREVSLCCCECATVLQKFPHDCWKNKLLCLALVQEKLIHGRCGTTNIFSPLLDLVFIQTRVGDGGGMQRWGEDIKNIVQQMLTCKQMNFKREEEEFRFVSALQLEWSLTTSVQMLQNTCWLPPQLVQEPHK